MKLVQLLGTAVLVCLAAGCSSEATSTSDAAVDTGKSDTGTPIDTGTPVDTGTVVDTGTPVDAGTCADCILANCKTENEKCLADTACKKRIDCMAACKDVDCMNKCISDNPTTLGDDYVTCLAGKCKTICGLG